jgi:hypothetical protein
MGFVGLFSHRQVFRCDLDGDNQRSEPGFIDPVILIACDRVARGWPRRGARRVTHPETCEDISPSRDAPTSRLILNKDRLSGMENSLRRM